MARESTILAERAELAKVLSIPIGKQVKYICDASVLYLSQNYVVNSLKENYPTAKIIILVREPAERLLSHVKKDNCLNYSDSDALISDLKKENQEELYRFSKSYVRLSHYSNDINIYKKRFGESNVLILNFDSMSSWSNR